MTIRLSICIPTYNFGRYIGETLAAIISQVRNAQDVEILIVDGASTDDTPSVVRSFQQHCPQLVYHRLPQKGGIDTDLELAIELARGEYCWMLSSDDVPVTGAVAALLNEVGSNDDIYLFNRIECDSVLTPLRTRFWLTPDTPDRTFRFSNAKGAIAYFERARSLGALFSYISSLVVRRTAWRKAPAVDGSIGSNYAHVGRLFTVLQRGGTLHYVRKPFVLCRGYNDSFLQSGLVRRFQIDLDGYLLLADRLFPDEAVRRAFLSVMKRQHRWYVYVEIRSFIGQKEPWGDLAQKLARFGYSPREVFLIDALGSFRPGVRFARLIISAYRKVQFLVARLHRFRALKNAGKAGLQN